MYWEPEVSDLFSTYRNYLKCCSDQKMDFEKKKKQRKGTLQPMNMCLCPALNLV